MANPKMATTTTPLKRKNTHLILQTAYPSIALLEAATDLMFTHR